MPSCAIPQAAGAVMTFVASSRPPRPTSITHPSAGCSEKARQAAAVVTSKKMAPMSSARSEEHTSELPSLTRSSYAVFCLNKKNNYRHHYHTSTLLPALTHYHHI